MLVMFVARAVTENRSVVPMLIAGVADDPVVPRRGRPGPEGPVAPVAPVAPTPVGPVAPVTPVGPVGPVAPLDPFAPMNSKLISRSLPLAIVPLPATEVRPVICDHPAESVTPVKEKVLSVVGVAVE